MAITKKDCLVLLNSLKEDGIDVTEMTKKAALSKDVSIEVVQFINKNRPFEVSNFYEKLRKSYNNKKSQLYKQIVKSDEVDEPKDIIITLSSLGLQIMLYAKQIEDPHMFLQQARYQELASCLYKYSMTYDLLPAINLLRLFKMDLKAFEYLNKDTNNVL